MGLWSTAVLNLNNMRDLDSDSHAGKQTIPMLLGEKASRIYHLSLVSGGALCLFFFALVQQLIWVAGALPGFLLMLKTLPAVLAPHDVSRLDRQLKPQALGTFLAVFGMALLRMLFS